MLKMRTTINHVRPTYIDWSQGTESLKWDCDKHPDMSPMRYLRDVLGISPYKIVEGEIECPSDVMITIIFDRDYTDKKEVIVRAGG